MDGKKHGLWVVAPRRTGTSGNGPMWTARYTASGSCASRTGPSGKCPYVNGKMHGRWVDALDANGDVHEGLYVDGKKHGRWVMALVGAGA